ncbi:MAG: 6-bladed beta-propeller [Acidobacteriota bacterium]|nr:6-bladed beta-propeller [Acidobacteriota bacterium]
MISCRSTEDEGYDWEKARIPLAGNSKHRFPMIDRTVSKQLQLRVQQAESLKDLFPAERIVMLETTDESVIGYINDLAYVDGFWYVVDRFQPKLLQFLESGAFSKQIGREGEGPGEYGQPAFVRPCYDGNIALYDRQKSRIHVFTRDGTWIKSTPIAFGGMYYPDAPFIWDDKDRLYLGGLSGFSPKSPRHVLMEVSENRIKPVRGFGKKPEELVGLAYSLAWRSMLRVDDFIWIGSPYKTKLEVYDMNGGFAGAIGDISRPNELDLDEFLKVANSKNRSREKLREIVTKKYNRGLYQVGDLVVSNLDLKSFDIYDRWGNLLRTDLKNNMPVTILTGYDNKLVSRFIISEKGKRFMTDNEIGLLDALGWEEDKNGEDNPYLRIGVLKP